MIKLPVVFVVCFKLLLFKNSYDNPAKTIAVAISDKKYTNHRVGSGCIK